MTPKSFTILEIIAGLCAIGVFGSVLWHGWKDCMKSIDEREWRDK